MRKKPMKMLMWPNLLLVVLFGFLTYRGFGRSLEDGMVLATTPGTLTMREAMYYALSRPVSTIIVGCDTVAQLEENVQLAREFTPLSDEQLADVVKRAGPVSKPSVFFRFYERA